MGDLDFDVRISTNHLDAAALMSDIGTALAHGTFRVPARLSTERALELVVVARSGAVAMKGKVEVLGYEGEHTWLRFLSASDHASSEAHLILSEVEIELAQRQTARVPTAGAPTRPPPPARGTKPMPPKVVAVPPRARPTASHAAVGDPTSEPAPAAAEPRRQLPGSEIPPRAATRATGVVNAVRVPPRPPPRSSGHDASLAMAPAPSQAPAFESAPAQAAPVPAASPPSSFPPSSPGAFELAAPPPVAVPVADPVASPVAAVSISSPVTTSAAPRGATEDQALPLPPPPSTEPVAQLPLESVVPWWNAAAPPPPAAAPPARSELVASPLPVAPPPVDPFRQSDSVARFGTAPIETSQDAARAYLPETQVPPPRPAPRTPLSPREKRMLGASCAIAAVGFAVAGAALWATRAAPAAASLVAPRCEPATASEPSAPGPAASAAVTSSDDSQSCELQVSSNAALAEIWIDGERRGKVPAKLEVPCRPTSIALRHPRYLTAQREVVPSAGTTEVAMRLTRPMVNVKIESKPPGANVRVNGRAIGKTPLSTKVLAFERGTVVLSHDGGAIKTMQIYPQTDNTLVSATLPKPRARARTSK